MQSTTIGNRNPSKSLHNVAESARESAEHLSSEMANKASRLATDVSENAGEYYGKASGWIQQNYGKTLGVIGFIAAIGTIGYLIGRNTHSETMPTQRF